MLASLVDALTSNFSIIHASIDAIGILAINTDSHCVSLQDYLDDLACDVNLYQTILFTPLIGILKSRYYKKNLGCNN